MIIFIYFILIINNKFFFFLRIEVDEDEIFGINTTMKKKIYMEYE